MISVLARLKYATDALHLLQERELHVELFFRNEIVPLLKKVNLQCYDCPILANPMKLFLVVKSEV